MASDRAGSRGCPSSIPAEQSSTHAEGPREQPGAFVMCGGAGNRTRVRRCSSGSSPGAATLMWSQPPRFVWHCAVTRSSNCWLFRPTPLPGGLVSLLNDGEFGAETPPVHRSRIAQAARATFERATVALLFAIVFWQVVHEITAILGPLLPSITADVETCHPPVELSPANRLLQGYGSPLPLSPR